MIELQSVNREIRSESCQYRRVKHADVFRSCFASTLRQRLRLQDDMSRQTDNHVTSSADAEQCSESFHDVEDDIW